MLRLQAAGELESRQALVEVENKRQRLQGAGQLDPCQTLVGDVVVCVVDLPGDVVVPSRAKGQAAIY